MTDETFQSHFKTFVDRTIWSTTFWLNLVMGATTVISLASSDLQQFLSPTLMLKITAAANLLTIVLRLRTAAAGSIKPS
jgi:hypothetical protein